MSNVVLLRTQFLLYFVTKEIKDDKPNNAVKWRHLVNQFINYTVRRQYSADNSVMSVRLSDMSHTHEQSKIANAQYIFKLFSLSSSAIIL